jgi:hypothetical protein
VQTAKNIRLLFSFLDIKDVDLVHSVDQLCVLGALLICNQNNMELNIFYVLHYFNKRSILFFLSPHNHASNFIYGKPWAKMRT